MKKQTNVTDPNNLGQPSNTVIKDGVKNSSSIKKDRQLKSIVFLAVTSVVLVAVCILYLVLALGQKDDPPPKDRYMNINTVSGNYNIKITDVLSNTQIVTNFSSLDKQYIELVGDTADVFCFADGTVTSIELTPDKGAVITIQHIPGMYSTYTFIDADENLQVGQEVVCGQNLGVIYQQEPLILRFEINLDGKNIDPAPYVVK